MNTESAAMGGTDKSEWASKWIKAMLFSGKRFDPMRRYINGRTYKITIIFAELWIWICIQLTSKLFCESKKKLSFYFCNMIGSTDQL